MDWAFIIERSISTLFGIEVMVFAMAAVGLNIQFGYAGLLNFGQVGFMAAGAYGLGVSINYFGMNFWLGLVFGVVYSIVLALILGLPTLRLRGRLPRHRHDRGVGSDPTAGALAQHEGNHRRLRRHR